MFPLVFSYFWTRTHITYIYVNWLLCFRWFLVTFKPEPVLHIFIQTAYYFFPGFQLHLNQDRYYIYLCKLTIMFPQVGIMMYCLCLHLSNLTIKRWLEIYHWSFLINFMVLVWLLYGVKLFSCSIFIQFVRLLCTTDHWHMCALSSMRGYSSYIMVCKLKKIWICRARVIRGDTFSIESFGLPNFWIRS